MTPAETTTMPPKLAILDETITTDQWLVETCQTLPGTIFTTIVAPWTNAVRSADKARKLAETQATEMLVLKEDEVNEEINMDFKLLENISSRFSGLKLPTPKIVIGEKVEQLKSKSASMLWEAEPRSIDLWETEPRSIDRIYQFAENRKSISQNFNGLYSEWLLSYGFWTFVVIWFFSYFSPASFGYSSSLGRSFLFSLIVTLGLPVISASQSINSARRWWNYLVDAIAMKHYWLIYSVLAKTEREANELIEATAAEIEKTLSEMVRSVENTTIELKATINEIYEAGCHKTASTSDESQWASWAPASEHAGVVRLGELNICVMALPTGYQYLAEGTEVIRGITLPVVASLKNGRSIYIGINDHPWMYRGYRVAQNIIFRILSSAPPAKVLFTFIDPIGQGQNIASFLSLADYDEALVNSKAWTDPRQIERKLTDITEHMETVIQKYLRTDYATIDDYNKAAGEIAEPYRVVVVFDFPDSISENAARQLERIVQNGRRCGVYAIVVHDTAKKASYGVNEANITKHSLSFSLQHGAFFHNYGYDNAQESRSLVLDETPPEDLVRRVIKTIGEQSKEALKVEVPYRKLLQLAGIEGNCQWSASTANGIRIPLGPGNARVPRFLELGVGLSVHALVIGRPGSGKSNLMHVVITTAALQYSPEELQLYLIDFKEGVEFRPYAEASLPHASVIAIKSEREFGLSVLRRLDKELKYRGALFGEADVQHIAQYRQKIGVGGEKPKLPRILLVVDEFQEFFVKQDFISDEAALLFDRIVRQGRAFGLHLLLGSQTLAGYSLPKATLNLITVRIALQSSETDSRIILADDNTAARLLSRPGEGIYNSSSGLVEGNNLFQVALFDDEDRKSSLRLVNDRFRVLRAEGAFPIMKFPPPIVFEGHEPAVLEKSAPIAELLDASTWPERKRAFEVWLGEPVEIKPPTAMEVSRRGGNNLLVVTKDEGEAVGVLTAVLVSLIAQIEPSMIRISILDLTTADAPWADVPEHLQELFASHNVRVIGRRGLHETLEKLSTLVKEQSEAGQRSDSSHFLVLLGLHRVRDLRQAGYSSRFNLDEDSKPDLASLFASIVRDGSECGVHIMAWCDSYVNLERTMDNRLIADFGTRVVGQMSNSDSSRLVDDDSAAHIDRPHRLLKYDDNRVGVLEMFRPYALPSREWLEHVSATLLQRIDRAQGRIK